MAKKTIWHGAYGRQTRYDVVQHRYGCTDCEADPQGYIELLEIKDAPQSWRQWVVHVFLNDCGSVYYQLDSEEKAKLVYGTLCQLGLKKSELPKTFPGLLRTVRCGERAPWFYATGNARLDGWGDWVERPHLAHLAATSKTNRPQGAS